MPDNPIHIYLGLALAIFGAIYALRRTPGISRIWDAIPTDLKPFAPIAVGVLLAAIEAVASGRSVRQALAIAASAALTAMLAHHGLKAAPGPYGADKAPEAHPWASGATDRPSPLFETFDERTPTDPPRPKDVA